MRILIADDEAEITRALKTILERNHYTVDAVGSGREALDYRAGIQYDCAVLDVMMPGVDGLEVLRCMREGGRPHAGAAVDGEKHRGRPCGGPRRRGG